MLILVDGYNATMNSGLTASLSKEGQRDALVSILRVSGKRLLGTGSIVAVFDARDQLAPSSDAVGHIKVVYAPDADDEIVRRAARAGRQCTVVTDDNRLRARLSQDVGRHVRYVATAVLFTGAQQPPSRTTAPPSATTDADKRMSRSERDALARELLDLWGGDESDTNDGAT